MVEMWGLINLAPMFCVNLLVMNSESFLMMLSVCSELLLSLSFIQSTRPVKVLLMKNTCDLQFLRKETLMQIFK